MLESDVSKIAIDAFIVTLKVASPILITSMAVGLVISILQTTTSIQEQTLTFVPKLLAVGAALAIFFAYILGTVSDYTTNMYELIRRF